MTSPTTHPPPRLSLALRYRRICSKAEITSVGLAPSSSSAFAIYTAGQSPQSWIDVFDLSSRRGRCKSAGSRAAFSPGPTTTPRLATVRDWVVALPGGVELRHASTVVLRDAETGKAAGEIKEAVAGPIAWSRDGKLLAVAEAGHRMGVWDVRGGKRVGRVLSHVDAVTHAAFLLDHNLATASRDGTLRVTDPSTGKTLRRLEMGYAAGPPQVLNVSPDGTRVVSVWGTTVHVWLPGGGDVVTSYSLGLSREREAWPLCVSGDGRWMACRTEEGFDVMDVMTGEVVFERRGEGGGFVSSGAFSEDGRVLVLGGMDGGVDVWDVVEKR